MFSFIVNFRGEAERIITLVIIPESIEYMNVEEFEYLICLIIVSFGDKGKLCSMVCVSKYTHQVISDTILCITFACVSYCDVTSHTS